ncbi:hypothetical protein DLM46_13600 [Paraburkholderia lacunae]|uniref:Uncharacterized protein n=1 Tax=Paraburkholderia lacunae TaxID=2211104 RepID=A0A370N8R4_9BURK|nr:hypothetical protein DLM46_13600 [Paraburkholderia lacunae]
MPGAGCGVRGAGCGVRGAGCGVRAAGIGRIRIRGSPTLFVLLIRNRLKRIAHLRRRASGNRLLYPWPHAERPEPLGASDYRV